MGALFRIAIFFWLICRKGASGVPNSKYGVSRACEKWAADIPTIATTGRIRVLGLRELSIAAGNTLRRKISGNFPGNVVPRRPLILGRTVWPITWVFFLKKRRVPLAEGVTYARTPS